MSTTNNTDTETPRVSRRHQMSEDDKSRDRFFKTRNILNVLFMLGAVIGVILYFYANRTTGTIVILISMVFKIIECSLRFIH